MTPKYYADEMQANLFHVYSFDINSANYVVLATPFHALLVFKNDLTD